LLAQNLTDQEVDSLCELTLRQGDTNLERALDAANSLELSLSKANSKLSHSSVKTLKAILLAQKGLYDESLQLHFKALETRLSIQAYKAAAASELNIANTFFEIGQFENAVQYHHLGIKHLAMIEVDSLRLFHAYNDLASLYYYYDNLDSAQFYFTKAQALSTAASIKGTLFIADLLANLGQLHQFENDSIEAKSLYMQSLKIYEDNQDLASQVWIFHQLGMMQAEKGNYSKAIRLYSKGLQLLPSEMTDPIQLELYRSLHDSYLMLGKGDSAQKYFEKYIAKADTLFQQKLSKNINEAEARFQVKQKESELALAETENKQKQIRIYWLLASLLLLLISGFLVFWNYRKRQQVTELSLSLKNKELDELLRKQEIERVNALLKGQNKERRRIAQELHDRLGSLLLAAKLQYQKLERQLQKALEEQHKSQAQLNNLLQEATDEVRRISHDLYEGSLAQFGFVSAFNQLKDAIEAANPIKIHFEPNDLPEAYYKEFETELYRITQELLSNTLKYADAGKIEIIFTFLEERFIFQYRDDGKGFDLEQVNRGAGIGFKNIKDRVARIGGEMKLISEPEGGMQFQLKVKASHGGNKDDFS